MMVARTVLLLLLSGALPGVAAVTTVRYTDATTVHQNPNNKFFMLLLEEALQASQAEFGAYQLVAVNLVISQERQLKELNKGTFDVFWTMATPAREVDALAVNEPLMKGAYGIRLLVTHRENVSQLAQVNALAHLKSIELLSGADWPDTAILRRNHLSVTTELFDKELYVKLRQAPQYVFPRGLLEAPAELAQRNWPELVLNRTVILRYPAVMKFFVAKHNTALAKRLQAGLAQLKRTGRFDQLFYQFAPHAQALAQLSLHGAKIIELRSPFVVSETEKQAITAEQNALLQKLGLTLE